MELYAYHYGSPDLRLEDCVFHEHAVLPGSDVHLGGGDHARGGYAWFDVW
jgi:hypothetical protein